jgi:hypothetical protein
MTLMPNFIHQLVNHDKDRYHPRGVHDSPWNKMVGRLTCIFFRMTMNVNFLIFHLASKVEV